MINDGITLRVKNDVYFVRTIVSRIRSGSAQRDLQHPVTLRCFVYTSSYTIPYLSRGLCRPDALTTVLFRSIPNEFQSTSHSTCSRPLHRAIELHHFPLTRSSPFYAVVRSIPDTRAILHYYDIDGTRISNSRIAYRPLLLPPLSPPLVTSPLGNKSR